MQWHYYMVSLPYFCQIKIVRSNLAMSVLFSNLHDAASSWTARNNDCIRFTANTLNERVVSRQLSSCTHIRWKDSYWVAGAVKGLKASRYKLNSAANCWHDVSRERIGTHPSSLSEHVGNVIMQNWETFAAVNISKRVSMSSASTSLSIVSLEANFDRGVCFSKFVDLGFVRLVNLFETSVPVGV